MRLRQVILKNFRSYKDETKIDIDDLTAFIGKNDVGKSTILEALEIFFNDKLVKMDSTDVCVYGSDAEVIIGCAFDDLPNTLVIDESASTNLRDEYLLNREGFLELHKKFDCGGKVKQSIVAVALHPANPGLNDLLSLKNTDLKKRIKDRGINSDVNLSTNSSMRKALWNCEDLHLELTEVPLDKGEDAKVIWGRLEKWLPLYALFQADRPSKDEDPEVQDPMKLAVISALKTVEADLETVKNAVRKRVIDVAERTLAKLKDMDANLANQLKPDFKAEPKWDGLFKLTLAGDDQIPINKRGSGVRRLILLNFFRAEAERKACEENVSGVIYAIEEPETAQHPDNQKMLIEVLKELSEQDGSQVLLTTHVPGLASLLPQESIRFITRGKDRKVQVGAGSDDVYREVADTLGLLPDPCKIDDLKMLICVEGPHDIRFLSNISAILHASDPSLPDLKKDSRLAMIPLGGSTLKDWVLNDYLNRLHKPNWCVFDQDDAKNPQYKDYCEMINTRADSYACLTKKREMENYIHSDAIEEVFNVRVTFGDMDDVPQIVAREVHKASESVNAWEELKPECIKKKEGRAKHRLNDEASAKMTIERLKEIDPQDEVRGWLEDIARRLK